jgi:hypothetical protein
MITDTDEELIAEAKAHGITFENYIDKGEMSFTEKQLRALINHYVAKAIAEIQAEALEKAAGGQTTNNWLLILAAKIRKGETL